ncbi:MAG: stage 0 sporulation protein J, partial [Chloroflexi bacterium CG_4_10_14_0_8_um_filter_57_5]
TKVSLRAGRKGGTLTIHYYSDEELDALMARLLKE